MSLDRYYPFSNPKNFIIIDLPFFTGIFFKMCNYMQLRMYKTPDLETPKYEILKRAADYEVSKLLCV